MKKLLPFLLCLLGAIGIGVVQPRLAQDVHTVKQREDALLLPPPDKLAAMSLGYRAAGADFLWSQLVYEYGLHWAEHRAFPNVMRYIEAVLALEPDFQNIFLYGDTLIMYRPEGGTEADAKVARDLLVRGTEARPYDPEVWLHSGQFQAFVGSSYLKDEPTIEEWRRAGALQIAHAVELGADIDRSLAASTILRKSGEKDAALKVVQRAYAMTDDPELQRQLLFKFKQLGGGDDAELARTAVDRELRSRYGFLSRGEGLLIGPGRGAASCAGPQSYTRKRCNHDWQSFVDER